MKVIKSQLRQSPFFANRYRRDQADLTRDILKCVPYFENYCPNNWVLWILLSKSYYEEVYLITV